MTFRWLALGRTLLARKLGNAAHQSNPNEMPLIEGQLSNSIDPSITFIDSQASDPQDNSPDLFDLAPRDICKKLFDQEWYLRQNPDLKDYPDPIDHYIAVGSKQSLNPHPLFITGWYVANYPEVLDAGMNPLVHYVLHGGKEGRTPHPLFDPTWYMDQHVLSESHDCNLLLHYIQKGQFAGANPNPFFDTNWYTSRYDINDRTLLSPLEHYVKIGAREGLDPGPHFSSKVYLSLNKAARTSDLDPLSHYLIYGAKKGRPQFPPHCHAKVAVVFLARSETGSSVGLDRFARSYRKFNAGLAHDLIILRKGAMRKPGAALALALMFSEFNPQYLDIDDDGYDIQAYLKAALLLDNDYICFLNSHSEILADGWLQKLYMPLTMAKVGLSAATGSYESIYDSIGLECKAVWATEIHGIPYDELLAHELRSHLRKHSPTWMNRTRGPLALLEERYQDPSIEAIDRALSYGKYWDKMTAPDGPLYAMDRFPRFPNPHIRSNAFMMKRELLVSFNFDMDDTKLACIEFESGPNSLSAKVQNRGLQAVVVGANGNMYSVEQWPLSDTFRLGDQSNVLIADNRVREFEAFDENEKNRLRVMSWGEYIAPVPQAYHGIGFSFAKGSLKLDCREDAKITVPLPVKVSVVIPTHNRISLVKEALVTIIGQDYSDWECIVFDNASVEPLADYVESLQDDRIRYARSERFLPVTESWNEAIDRATGDYVVLIGDDDGLVPNCFSRLSNIVARFDQPDIIYSSLYQFFHPGVAPWEPSGTVTELQYGVFFSGRKEEFLLQRQTAESVVIASLQFRRCFTFNMQAFFFNRNYLNSIRKNGKVFHSPFPDYYLANVSLYLGNKVVVSPTPLSIAGVSRKSYGFTMFNDQEKIGDALLNTEFDCDPLYSEVEPDLLPGPTYNSNYLLTMYHVARAVGLKPEAAVRSDRYRRIQIWYALGGTPVLMNDQEERTREIDLAFSLTQQEVVWVSRLRLLGSLARSNDEKAAIELGRIAEEVAMYAPAELAVRSKPLATGDFANLPELYSALEAKRL